MKKTLHERIIVVFGVLIATVTTVMANTLSQDNLWVRKEKTHLAARSFDAAALPSRYEAFTLNRSALQEVLRNAPREFTGESGVILTMPMPDGTFSRFRIEHSPIVEPGLAAKYPQLSATYRGYGIDDPTASARFDFLPSGFHSLILSSRGTIVIDPYVRGEVDDYISYYKQDRRSSDADFKCEVGDPGFNSILDTKDPADFGFLSEAVAAPQVTNGGTLRTYRLALAGNAEYCAAASVGGNTVANCLAAQVLIMNRVNGVYERDLAIRMVIVATNNLIVYAPDNTTCPVGTGGSACNSGNDPYSNSSSALNQNTGNLNTVIGVNNYDVGHVFTTGSGGVAFLGVPCGANKGGGTTGLPSPLGDDFAIDFVAHEMGHQFGANHTFNASCGNNRSSSSAYEPGSGITVMGYAGVCGGSQDLAGHSIDTFHVKSLEAILAFVGGNTCDVETSTGNTAPTPTGPGNFTIPKLTPFALTASATDPNGDTLTYDWQEYNLGSTASAVPNSDNPNAMPIFRPYAPVSSGTRYFPSLQYILNNANVPPSTTSGFLTGELMPQIGGRTMVFQAVVRDNRANGGGINTVTSSLTVDANSGPFAVTSPNTNVTYSGGSAQTVTWNVSGTSGAPVNAANVNILYSNDGGNTFPFVLAAGTANDGSQTVNIPVGNTTTARIKVEAVGNVFFDISDTNFSVQGVVSPSRARADADGDGRTDLWIFRPSDGNHWISRSSGGQSVVLWGVNNDIPAPGDYDNDNKTDVAVWRPSNGIFYIINSSNGTFTGLQWGVSTDVPVVGDYNGDGRSDAAVWRSSNTTWYVLLSGGGFDIRPFGTAGDTPLAGDFDGDLKTDFASFNTTTANWRITYSSNGSTINFPFGSAGDKAVPAEYNGDAADDVAVFRASTGTWHIIESGGGLRNVAWGAPGDVPVPGDYDGDGRDDVAVYRNGTWHLLRSTAGPTALLWGVATDLATPRYYFP